MDSERRAETAPLGSVTRIAGYSSAQGPACCLAVCWVPALCCSLSSARSSPCSRGVGLYFSCGWADWRQRPAGSELLASLAVHSHWLGGVGACRLLMQGGPQPPPLVSLLTLVYPPGRNHKSGGPGMLKTFNEPGSEYFIFLLSTWAKGPGSEPVS